MNNYNSLHGKHDKIGLREESQHESDILNQLCVDKLDNAFAIEILLDGQAFEKYEFTSHDSKTFMENRRSLPSGERTVSTNGSMGRSTATEPRDDIESKARSFGSCSLPSKTAQPGYAGWRSPRQSQTNSTSSQGSRLSKRQEESLVHQSMSDIRKALQEMHKDLGQTSGQRKGVSRRKVIRGLSKMADNLEDPEERAKLRRELSVLMKEEKAERNLSGRSVPELSAFDGESKVMVDGGDETCTQVSVRTAFEDVDGKSQKMGKDTPTFRFTSSVFKAEPEEQSTAERVLDDLLWTEFVAHRQHTTIDLKDPVIAVNWDADSCISTLNTNSACSLSKASSLRRQRQARGQKVLAKLNASGPGTAKFPPSIKAPVNQRYAKHQEQQRDPPEKSSPEKSKSKSSRSWWRRRQNPLAGKDTFVLKPYRPIKSALDQQMYLPTSVSVRRPHKCQQIVANGDETVSVKSTYQAVLVDSASRHGFEMTKTTTRLGR
jgi:hypothetical protein